MDLQEYSQSLNAFMTSPEFAEMNPQQQQEAVAGSRNWYLEQNPDADAATVDTITEGTNITHLRNTGQGRALPIIDINLPSQDPKFKDLKQEEQLQKIEEYKLKIPGIAASVPTQKEDAEYFINQSVRQLERQVNGQKTGYIADKGKRLVEGFAAGLASGVGADSMAEGIQDFFHENTKYDEDFTAQLAQGLGSAGSSIVIIAGSAAIAGGLGATAATAEAIGVGASLASNGIMRYNDAYKNAIAKGLSEEQSHDMGVSAMPAAVIDALSDHIIASKLMPARVNKVFASGSDAAKKAMFREITADVALRGKMLNWAQSAITEGLAESVGDYAAAYGPYLLSGDKDYLPSEKESLNSFVIGGIIGGGLTSIADVPNLIGNKSGAKQTVVNPDGSTSEVTPQYSSKAERDVAETERMIPKLDPNHSSEVFGLLAEGRYKEARALSDKYLKESLQPVATPAVAPTVAPATTTPAPTATPTPVATPGTATAPPVVAPGTVAPTNAPTVAPTVTPVVTPAATVTPTTTTTPTPTVTTTSFTLPVELKKSAPRYGKSEIEFESDFDKAAYILAGDTKGASKAAPKFRAALANLGLTNEQIVAHGKKVRESLKNLAPAVTGERIVTKVPTIAFDGAVPKQSKFAQKAAAKAANDISQVERVSGVTPTEETPEATVINVNETPTPNETQNPQGEVGQAGGIPTVEGQSTNQGAAGQTQTGTTQGQGQGSQEVAPAITTGEANLQGALVGGLQKTNGYGTYVLVDGSTLQSHPLSRGITNGELMDLQGNQFEASLINSILDANGNTIWTREATTPSQAAATVAGEAINTQGVPAPTAPSATAAARLANTVVTPDNFFKAIRGIVPPDKMAAFNEMLLDIKMKNPRLKFTLKRDTYYPIEAAGLYDGGKNLVYISANNLDYRTVAHEVTHALTQADIRRWVSGRPETTHKAQLAAALADPNTPAHIKTLIDVYQVAAKKLGQENVVGIEQKAENLILFQTMGEEAYAMTTLDEFVAGAMTLQSFQEQLANIPYKGSSLWEHIVDALRNGLAWMRGIADPELLTRSDGENALVATLAATREIIDTKASRGRPASRAATTTTVATAPEVTPAPATEAIPGTTVTASDIANTPEETTQVVEEVKKETETLETLPDDSTLEQVTAAAPHAVATAVDAALKLGDEGQFKAWIAENFAPLIRFADLIWQGARAIVLSHVGFGQFDTTNVSNHDVVALHQTVNKQTLDTNINNEVLAPISEAKIQADYGAEINSVVDGYDTTKAVSFSMDTGEVSVKDLDASVQAVTPTTTTTPTETAPATLSPVEQTQAAVSQTVDPEAATALSPELASYWLSQGENKAVTALSQLLGQNENESPGIKQMIVSIGSNESPDLFPWCATAISWSLNKAGIKSSVQSARQFLNVGRKTTSPKYGDVVVMWNNNEKTGGKNGYGGHVSFYLGEVGDQVVTISGNVDDAVLVASFPKSRVLGYRSLAKEQQKSNINYLFIGRASEKSQFMNDALDTAKAMAASGKSSEQIRAATGWFPGKYDGKMRWELPDNNAKANKIDQILGPDGFRRLMGGLESQTTLGELLNHPDLFNAYPDMKDVVVTLNPNQQGGAYQSNTDSIEIYANGSTLLPRQMSTLLHEVQHAIQKREGFAKGGNTLLAADEIAKQSPEYIEATSQADKDQKNYEDLRDAAVKKIRDERGRESGLDIFLADLEPEVEAARDKAGKSRVNADYVTRNVQAYKVSGQEAFNAYQNIAGEVEARDVQARQTYNDEQRAATAPYSSENIAPEDAITLFHPDAEKSNINYLPRKTQSERADEYRADLSELMKEKFGIEIDFMDRAVPDMTYSGGYMRAAESFPEISDILKLGGIEKDISADIEMFPTDKLELLGTEMENAKWNDFDASARNQMRKTLQDRIKLVNDIQKKTHNLYSDTELVTIAKDAYQIFSDFMFIDWHPSNINYLPKQTRAQQLTNGYRRFDAITKGSITDKIDTPTQRIIGLLKDIKPSDIHVLPNNLQDFFFELVDNIYESRKGVVNPQIRVNSEEMIQRISAVKIAIDSNRINDMVQKFDSVIDFDGLNIDLDNRRAVEEAVNDYMEKEQLADVQKRQNKSAEAKARTQQIYQQFRDLCGDLRTQITSRFVDKDNYIKEIESIYGQKLDAFPSLKEFLGFHYDYAMTANVDVLESKKLYQHSFALQNILDGNFRGMDLTAEHIGKFRDVQDDINSLTTQFRDPVTERSKMWRALDWVNKFAELHQTKLQRISGYETSRRFIQEKLLGNFYDGIIRVANNQKLSFTEEYIAFRDKLLGREVTAEDKQVCAIMGRLMQRQVGEDPDAALRQNIKKERQSINNKINGSTTRDARKQYQITILPLFENMVKGLEEYGEGSMVHFMDTFDERARGTQDEKTGQQRRQLIEKTQEIFSRYTLASRILSEGLLGKTFNQQIAYIPNDVRKAFESEDPQTRELDDTARPEEYTNNKGLTAEQAHYKERQTSLGEDGYYSYNNEHTLKRNVEKLSVDHATLVERAIIKSRIKEGSDLFKIIAESENGEVKKQRVDFIKSLVMQVVDNATSSGAPQNAILQVMSKASKIYAQGALSGIHHIISQNVSAITDYGIRTGNATGWFQAASFYAANFDKVNKWLNENQRWTGDRAALEAQGLDASRTAVDEEGILNHPLVKWLNKFHEGAGHIITTSLRLGDNFSSKVTLLAEYQRLRQEKGYSFANVGDIDFTVTEGQLLTQATLNAERIVNTSNKALRADLFSDRTMSTTIIRNLLFSFASHSANLATQANLAVRDLIELRGTGAPQEEINSKIRTIGAILAQGFLFASSRFAVAALAGKLIIALAQSLFDDDEGKIEELETQVQIARKRSNGSEKAKIKINEAETELANAKSVRSIITKLENQSSTQSWFNQVIREASGSAHLAMNNQGIQNMVLWVPDTLMGAIAKEGQKQVEADLAAQIKVAKDKKNFKEVARLTEQEAVIGAIEYVPLTYSNTQGFGLPGVYGSITDAFKIHGAEAFGAYQGTRDWNYTDFLTAVATAGLVPSDVNKALKEIDKIEDAMAKRGQTAEAQQAKIHEEAKKPKRASFNDASFR